jgi:hypothetical protein
MTTKNGQPMSRPGNFAGEAADILNSAPVGASYQYRKAHTQTTSWRWPWLKSQDPADWWAITRICSSHWAVGPPKETKKWSNTTWAKNIDQCTSNVGPGPNFRINIEHSNGSAYTDWGRLHIEENIQHCSVICLSYEIRSELNKLHKYLITYKQQWLYWDWYCQLYTCAHMKLSWTQPNFLFYPCLYISVFTNLHIQYRHV